MYKTVVNCLCLLLAYLGRGIQRLKHESPLDLLTGLRPSHHLALSYMAASPTPPPTRQTPLGTTAAPAYLLPTRELYAVEYPGTIKNGAEALRRLGGAHTLAQVSAAPLIYPHPPSILNSAVPSPWSTRRVWWTSGSVRTTRAPIPSRDASSVPSTSSSR
jgi:hypothetical protein